MRRTGLTSGTAMRCSGQPIRALLLVTADLLTCFCSGFGTSAAFAAGAYAQKKHDAKRQVEALEEQWRLAPLTGDAPTKDKKLLDDYIGISLSGPGRTKAHQLDRGRAPQVNVNTGGMSAIEGKVG